MLEDLNISIATDDAVTNQGQFYTPRGVFVDDKELIVIDSGDTTADNEWQYLNKFDNKILKSFKDCSNNLITGNVDGQADTQTGDFDN